MGYVREYLWTQDIGLAFKLFHCRHVFKYLTHFCERQTDTQGHKRAWSSGPLTFLPGVQDPSHTHTHTHTRARKEKRNPNLLSAREQLVTTMLSSAAEDDELEMSGPVNF